MPKPNTAIEWTVERAAREFGIDRRTVARRISEQGIKPNSNGHFTTRQVCASVFGDIAGERLRKTRGEADKIEMENRKNAGELIDIGEAVELASRFCFAIRQKIILSNLTEEEKQAILTDIRSLKDADFTQLKNENQNP